MRVVQILVNFTNIIESCSLSFNDICEAEITAQKFQWICGK